LLNVAKLAVVTAPTQPWEKKRKGREEKGEGGEGGVTDHRNVIVPLLHLIAVGRCAIDPKGKRKGERKKRGGGGKGEEGGTPVEGNPRSRIPPFTFSNGRDDRHPTGQEGAIEKGKGKKKRRREGKRKKEILSCPPFFTDGRPGAGGEGERRGGGGIRKAGLRRVKGEDSALLHRSL